MNFTGGAAFKKSWKKHKQLRQQKDSALEKLLFYIKPFKTL